MESLTKAEIKAVAARGFHDPVFFCQHFLPQIFSKPLPWFHKGILAVMERRADFLAHDPDFNQIQDHFVTGEKRTQIFNDDFTLNLQKHVLIMMARGHAKTTLAGQAMPTKRLCYRESKFTLYVSEAAPHAEMQLGNVQGFCEGPRITTIFGQLKPERSEDLKWNSKTAETRTGSVLIARGAGGQVRGLNWNGQRPHEIIIDDLENKEEAQSEDQRKKIRTWFFSDLLPCLSKEPGARATMLATLVHADALPTYLQRDMQWTSIVLDVRDRKGVLIWPEYYTEANYEADKQSAANAGELSSFYMEYHQKKVATEEQKFRPDFIRLTETPPRSELTVAIMYDPAISRKTTEDWACIYVVGVGRKGQKYVLDNWRARGKSAYEQLDAYFKLAKRWKPTKHGFEAQAFQQALGEIMRELMFREKYYFKPVEVRSNRPKISRVEGILQPLYASGYISHCRNFPELVTQLMDWPNVAHDDDVDCVASAIELLEPFAGMAGGADSGKDEYPPLEEMIGGEATGI